MSESLPTGVICPGQRKLMGDDGNPNYLRAMFMVYWDGSNTSAQPFYLHEHRFRLTLAGISALEAEVLGLMQQYYHLGNTPIEVVYLGYEGIAMTANDLSNIGWRLLTATA
jgi:hypothetical protein